MLRLILLLVIVGGLLLLALAAALFHFFGMWGLLAAAALFVGLLTLLPFLIKRLAAKFLVGLFASKAEALKGATLQLHAVTPADAAESSDVAPGWRWYNVDVTIVPAGRARGMPHWDLDDLRLIDYATAATTFEKDLKDNNEKDDAVIIHRSRVWMEGRFTADGDEDVPSKFHGPQRILLHAAVKPGLGRLKCRYYVHDFGDIQLPA